MPTRPDLAKSPKEGERRRSGARLKISVLNDRLVVGFTGQVDAGKHLLRELKARYEKNVPSPDQLSAALRSSNILLSGKAHLVGWLATSEPRCFQWSARPGNHVEWVDYAIMGSGAQHFEQKILPIDKHNISSELQGQEAAAYIALTKLNEMLSSELRDAETFRNNYGYGSEVIIWNGERFSHRNKITFFFIEAIVAADSFKSRPVLVRIYERRERFALVQTCPLYDHLGPNGKSGQHYYVDMVSPLEDDIEDVKVEKVALDPQSPIFCVGIGFCNPERTKGGFMHYAGEKDLVELNGSATKFQLRLKDSKGLIAQLRTILGYI